MRLLDCKQEFCQEIISGAPHNVDYLCDQCEGHWNGLLLGLSEINIPYEINHRIVRGFDYYTRTVFEIVPPVEGSQSTLVGGGRYDGLIQELGGRPTPGIGFGMGIERVVSNLRRQEVVLPDSVSKKTMVIHIGAAKMYAMKLVSNLRQSGLSATLGPAGRSLRSQLRYASVTGATHAIIVGDDEIRKGMVILRDLSKSEQQEVNSEHLIQALGSDSDR